MISPLDMQTHIVCAKELGGIFRKSCSGMSCYLVLRKALVVEPLVQAAAWLLDYRVEYLGTVCHLARSLAPRLDLSACI